MVRHLQTESHDVGWQALEQSDLSVGLTDSMMALVELAVLSPCHRAVGA